jgi:predicted nuclease with TOPRIM domain
LCSFFVFAYQLTPEDEDRRRRRRERNKIAATKCRLKKRECINNLMRESETLETQNVDLKAQLKNLEEEYKYLNEMWQSHQLECKSMALLGAQPCLNNETNCNSNGSIASLIDEIEMIKDTNNNKHYHNQDQNSQLPSLTPLINCNVSFDFY